MSASEASQEVSTSSSREVRRSNGDGHVVEIELETKSDTSPRPQKGKKKSQKERKGKGERVKRAREASKDGDVTHVEDAVALNLSASRLSLAKLPFKDLSYSIKEKGEKGKKKKRQILRGISGHVGPAALYFPSMIECHFLAVMGPTGSGKTTLLSVLGHRVTHGVTGDLLVNGESPTGDFKRQMSFVLQDDVLFPNLTVEQTLQYTAELRLGNLDTEERRERVRQVMDVLNLNKAKNTKIGDGVSRGVSGGERKRVNIGNELLTQPSLLLLDEPTSGLDTSTAINLMQALKGLADSGLTIIASIHQPSSQVFELFDSLLLLVDGAPIFYGPAKKAVPYFSSIGLKCSKYYNPADFMMGLILQEEIVSEGGSSMKETLVKEWKESKMNKNDAEIRDKKALMMLDECKEKQARIGTPSYSLSFFEQVSILTRRAFFQTKGVQLDWLNFVETFLMALIVGAFWFQTPNRVENFSDRAGALTFVISYISFFTPAFKSLFDFPPERQVVQRERLSGSYRLSSYYIAKLIADFPFSLIHPTLYVILAYFLIGLRLTAGAFFTFYAIIIVTAFTMASLGILVSALTAPDLKRAIVFILFVAGGFWVQNVPFWLDWIQYLSVMTYAFHASLLTDISGTTWTSGNETIAGAVLLEPFNLWFDSEWIYILVILLWGVAFRVIGFFTLRFSLRLKA